jgi:hypothetical protein
VVVTKSTGMREARRIIIAVCVATLMSCGCQFKCGYHQHFYSTPTPPTHNNLKKTNIQINTITDKIAQMQTALCKKIKQWVPSGITKNQNKPFPTIVTLFCSNIGMSAKLTITNVHCFSVFSL